MGTLQDLAAVCLASQRYRDIHELLSETTDLATFLSSIVEREDAWKVLTVALTLSCLCP